MIHYFSYTFIAWMNIYFVLGQVYYPSTEIPFPVQMITIALNITIGISFAAQAMRFER